MSLRGSRGFTLIEVLVSVFLLAVLSAFCYETLSYVRHARDGTAASFDRIRGLELAVHALVTDFAELEPRPVRDVLGTTFVPALYADGRSTDVVSMTRGGWPNAAGLERSTLQRVTYSLENGTLVRRYYTVLDATAGDQPVRRELLKDVVAVSIRYLDPSRQWQTQWPPLTANAATTNALPLSTRPLAAEVTIELKDMGKIVRLIEIPG
jgi:general secretion pathway protein J